MSVVHNNGIHGENRYTILDYIIFRSGQLIPHN
jgi:hypothetical protein